jgi:uncharacterized protein YndB with AHSA1/START domain
MSESLRVVDGRNVLEMRRRLAHPRAVVWRAITEPEQMRHWFPAALAEFDLVVGGKVRYVFEAHGGEGADGGDGGDGEVTAVDPPRLIEYTWNGSILRWELEPADGGTLLVFTHVFDDRPGAASFAAGWDSCVAALRALLDGVEPPAPGRMVAEHEDFVRRFGLDEGTVERTGDGYRVRFERQLTAPAERVWAEATGGAEVTVGGAPPAGLGGGTVTEVEPHRLLAFDGPDGRVRWELGEGTGHGARLVVTATGPRDASTPWHDRVEGLATALARGR